MAWRRAGETFSAVSRLALPRALLWAGLRAGLGAAALVATHGPVGFRPQARPFALDATSGRRGTLAMSAAREVAELGEPRQGGRQGVGGGVACEGQRKGWGRGGEECWGVC